MVGPGLVTSWSLVTNNSKSKEESTEREQKDLGVFVLKKKWSYRMKPPMKGQ